MNKIDTDITNVGLRKIIHIDMDSFYASVEIRDNPNLAHRPIAVGNNSERGVLCTCNYIARSYGVRSAMSNKVAYQKCPELLILPVNMAKYQQVSKSIREIFYQFTDLVEPLSLDEAYLDVTDNLDFQNSATLMAQEIRRLIWERERLTASAGVAPNKFLAKIASTWNKPNGIFVITPNQVENFVRQLSVDKLFGVGRVTAAKLHNMNIRTCQDLQKLSLVYLVKHFGSFGQTLYNQARGIDNRLVNNIHIRKSLGIETTFIEDISDYQRLILELDILYANLTKRYTHIENQYKIKSLYVKVKYKDFKTCTRAVTGYSLNREQYILLMQKLLIGKAIRLLGIGVRLVVHNDKHIYSLFDENY